MTKKEAKRRSREARLADQARYDDVTRRMLERIEQLRRQSQEPERRDSS